MSDESEPVTEGLKAVKELARTGQVAIEAGSDLAKYVGRILGTIPEDTVGLYFGDRLHIKRIMNATKILREALQQSDARGVENPEEIDLKHLQPLLEALSEESNETLQDMWANLIANAMDPNNTAHFQKIFIQTLREFEPIDATLLKAVNSSIQASPDISVSFNEILEDSGQRVSLVAISLQRMKSLGCLKLNQNIDDNYGEIVIWMTPLGEEIVMACDPGAST